MKSISTSTKKRGNTPFRKALRRSRRSATGSFWPGRRPGSTLWSNYKTYQRTYVDPEDLTLANTCAVGGSEKGAAVQQWVLALWAKYYEVKDLLAAAETLEALRAVDISTEALTPPPYTIRELNEEAVAVQKV